MNRPNETYADQNVLSRREREILELLYRVGPSSVSQIRDAILDRPTYSGVRGLLRILLIKGYVTYDQLGKGYVYRPVEPRKRAGEKALAHVIETYFRESPYSVVETLLQSPQIRLSHEHLLQFRRLIEKRIAGETGVVLNR